MMKEKEPIFAVISDEIFTDREELLAYLKRIALGAKVEKYISQVLIGHRRVGKTEVLKRLYNQLFWEQDEVTPNKSKTGVTKPCFLNSNNLTVGLGWRLH